MDIILFFRVMAHTSNPCCGNHGLQDNNRVGPALRYVNYFRNVCFFILFLNKSSMELALFHTLLAFSVFIRLPCDLRIFICWRSLLVFVRPRK